MDRSLSQVKRMATKTTTLAAVTVATITKQTATHFAFNALEWTGFNNATSL